MTDVSRKSYPLEIVFKPLQLDRCRYSSNPSFIQSFLLIIACLQEVFVENKTEEKPEEPKKPEKKKKEDKAKEPGTDEL